MKRSLGLGFVLLAILIGEFQLQLPGEELRDVKPGWSLVIDDSLNIYTNIDEQHIAKYSPEGKQLLLIGRKGEGPGDIKRFGGMALDPKDSLLYVSEFFEGNKRISIFSSIDGHFVKIWPCQLDRAEWPAASVLQFDSQGNVYLQVENVKWRKHRSFEISSSYRAVIKFDHTGKKIKELFHHESDVSAYRRQKGHPNLPYRDYLNWVILQDRIYVRQNNDKYISVLTLDGAPVKKIPLPFDRLPVTKKDVEAWEKSMLSFPRIRQGIAEGWFDIDFWKKNLPFPEFKTISGGPLLAGPDNELFSHKVSPEYDGDEQIFAIISPDSGLVKIHRFPDSVRLKAIKNNLFYFYATDEDDEPILKILDKEQALKQKL